MSDRVTISISENVADVSLNRADKLNAMDLKMFTALGAAADSLHADRSVRAVVLHGTGGNLCAGIDLGIMGDSSFDFRYALGSPVEPSAANLFQRAAYGWRELPIPVICAVEGVAFGAGLQLALGADIRIAAPNAKLSIMEAKWGIIPDMGISVTLRDLVAPDRVKELAWSGRIVGSAEALELGLVTSIADDPVRQSFALAASCAANSPEATRGVKELVNRAWRMSDADALALEASLQSDIIGGVNQLEAVKANLSKRKPEYKD